jgi:methionyl aminopeptidase
VNQYDDTAIEIKSDNELQLMQQAGQLLREVVSKIIQAVRPGIPTIKLDKMARTLIEQGGGRPAFLGYRDYPATICVSINEQVVHGIPSTRRLRDGDIVSIDVGLLKEGFYVDKAVTVPVGNVSRERRRLVRVTEEALRVGINAARLNQRLGDLSAAVQAYVEAAGFSVVREYTGHGIGRKIHEPPQIPNFGKAGTGPRLQPGMVLAIEPMVNMGTWKTVTLDDQWTVVTEDGLPSAHFENTVAVTNNEPWILT